MKLYLVRHGQSENNLTKKFTGWAKKVALTEQGYEDARRAGQRLKGISFDRIYSSDLNRAVQTAQTAIPGCEPIQLPELREISLGELEMQYIDECAAKYGEAFNVNRANYDFVPYGGENGEMLDARIAQFFHMLEADPQENIAAFAHAGTLRSALRYVLKFPVSRIKCLNCCIAVFSYENGAWYLESWGA